MEKTRVIIYCSKKSVESRWATCHCPCNNQVKNGKTCSALVQCFTALSCALRHFQRQASYTQARCNFHAHTHTPVDSSAFSIFPEDTLACELDWRLYILNQADRISVHWDALFSLSLQKEILTVSLVWDYFHSEISYFSYAFPLICCNFYKHLKIMKNALSDVQSSRIFGTISYFDNWF